MELLLDRADKLVKGLAGENERWRASIIGCKMKLVGSLGMRLLPAFLSYAGPFDTQYRSNLVQRNPSWGSSVLLQFGCILSATIRLVAGFRCKGTTITIYGEFYFCIVLCPTNGCSTMEHSGASSRQLQHRNGAISVRCSRWPHDWIRNFGSVPSLLVPH